MALEIQKNIYDSIYEELEKEHEEMNIQERIYERIRLLSEQKPKNYEERIENIYDYLKKKNLVPDELYLVHIYYFDIRDGMKCLRPKTIDNIGKVLLESLSVFGVEKVKLNNGPVALNPHGFKKFDVVELQRTNDKNIIELMYKLPKKIKINDKITLHKKVHFIL